MMRKTPLKRGTSTLKKSPLRKSGKTKEKKVARQKAFYSSAAWKKLRKEALERAGNRCEYVTVDMLYYRCEETEKLQVHHKTNRRFADGELPADLVVWCKYHHQRHHALEGKRIR